MAHVELLLARARGGECGHVRMTARAAAVLPPRYGRYIGAMEAICLHGGGMEADRRRLSGEASTIEVGDQVNVGWNQRARAAACESGR